MMKFVLFGFCIGVLIPQMVNSARCEANSGVAWSNSDCTCPRGLTSSCNISTTDPPSEWETKYQCLAEMVNSTDDARLHDTNQCPCNFATKVSAQIIEDGKTDEEIYTLMETIFNDTIISGSTEHCTNSLPRQGGVNYKTVFKGLVEGKWASSTEQVEWFRREKTVTHNSIQYKLIVSNGIPEHCYADDDSAYGKINGHACEHYLMMIVPTDRKSMTQGEFHISNDGYLDGIMKGLSTADETNGFLNSPFNAMGDYECNLSNYCNRNGLDHVNAHSDGAGRYHYHGSMPQAKDYYNCGLLGYFLDGSAMYGRCTLEINGADVEMVSCYRKNNTDLPGVSHSQWVWDDSQSGCNLDKANGFPFTSDAKYNGNVMFTSGDYAIFQTADYPQQPLGLYENDNMAYFCHFDWR